MKNVFLKTSILVLCAFLNLSGILAQQYTYSFQWGTMGSGNRQFHAPAAIAIAEISGNVYVADAGNNRIVKFNSNGIYITHWGTPGSSTGQFNYPTGIAVDASETWVYVADQNNNRIQKFSNSGTYNNQINNGAGSGTGQFRSPTAVAVDGSGNIYVADSGNDRILKFSSSFSQTAQLGGFGSGNGQFNYPTGIAFYGTHIYVSDQNNHRIQKLNISDLSYNSQWSSWTAPNNGLFYAPTGVSVDGSGNVYVMDAGNSRLIKFNSSATFITQVGSCGSGDGLFNYATGCAVSSTGDLYVADQNNYRIQVFRAKCRSCTQLSNYSLSDSWGGSGTDDGEFNSPSGVAIDPSGNVYVADEEDHHIQKFSSDGTFLDKWGTPGSANGELNRPLGIAIDASGNVYVVDSGNDRIQKFSGDGTYITSWGSEGTGTNQFRHPYGIAVDGAGNVYVSDNINDRIQKFSSSDGITYSQIDEWGEYGTTDGKFLNPCGIAVDEAGNVFVADAGNGAGVGRIQKFESDGDFIDKWFGHSTEHNPEAVAVDALGNVYVADPRHNNRIEKFTNNGTFIVEFASGTDNWVSYDKLQWLAVDKSCNVYTSDIFIPGVKVFSGFNPNPFITSFTPTSGGICPKLVITGSGFTGATAVSINGVAASSFTVNSSTQITANFTASLTTGPVIVTIPSCGSLVSSTDFTVQSCSTHTYEFESKWTPAGTYAMDMDGLGNFFMAGGDYIRKYSSNGTLLNTWGGTGNDPGEFSSPVGVAVDASGTVYVLDQGNNRMQYFDNDGDYLGQWSLGANTTGWGLAIDKSNNLYVANNFMATSYKIKKYSAQGMLLAQFIDGSVDLTNNCTLPRGIAVDACGRIFITISADDVCNLFEVRVLNSSSGALIARWGEWGQDEGEFINPKGITVDESGHVYVCDSEDSYLDVYNNRIQKFTATGTFLGEFGSTGTTDGLFSVPSLIEVDMSCNLYVLDGSGRMQKFSPNSIGARKAYSPAPIASPEAKVFVQPNPGVNQFHISVPGKNNFELVLLNSLGEEVFRTKSSQENYLLSDPSLSEGVYILNIISEGLTERIKLVVAK